MRDLVFKNLISESKKRRIIASSEISDKEGVRSIIHRHFVYMVKEITDQNKEQINKPYLYVLKEKNTKHHFERFFCRIKGSLLAVHEGKPILVLYMHSLKITFLRPCEKVSK